MLKKKPSSSLPFGLFVRIEEAMRGVDFRTIFLLCLIATFFSSCASQAPYLARETETTRVTDSAIALAGVGVAAGGGAALGATFGGPVGGVVGGLGGAGIAYGLEQFYNNKRVDAYYAGVKDGEDATRASILKGIYEREAVYAIPAPWIADQGNNPTVRNVYVPTRTIDGVKYDGDYQRVPVYK